VLKHDGFRLRFQSDRIVYENMTSEISTYVKRDQKKYVGVFNLWDCCPQGQGTMTYSSGLEYTGEWDMGLFHGKGSITYPDGIIIEGKWKKGIPQFDALHPLMNKCIDNGNCTGTLPFVYPQILYNGECAHCCVGVKVRTWHKSGARCCNAPSIKSVKRQKIQ
jgi:hypothetical protein